jgi:hypothetical protein
MVSRQAIIFNAECQNRELAESWKGVIAGHKTPICGFNAVFVWSTEKGV